LLKRWNILKGLSGKKIDLFEKFERDEGKVIELTNKSYSEELQAFRHCFNLLGDALVFLSLYSKYHPFDSDRKSGAFLISTRVFRSLKAYIGLVRRGYYYDASIIFRSILESVYICMCLSKDENHAKRWFEGDLKFGRVKRELGVYADQYFLEFYNDLSNFTHSNFQAVLSLFKKTEEQGLTKLECASVAFEKESRTAIMIYPCIQVFLLYLLDSIFANELDTVGLHNEILQFIEETVPHWVSILQKYGRS